MIRRFSGHSDGASIALIYAAARVGSVRGLVAIAPHTFVEKKCVENIAAIRTDASRSDVIERLGSYHTDAAATFWGWSDIWLDPAFGDWSIEATLHTIDCPVLVIQAPTTRSAPEAMVTGVTENVSARPLHILDDCGHSPHRDQPKATVEAIANWSPV